MLTIDVEVEETMWLFTDYGPEIVDGTDENFRNSQNSYRSLA